MTHPSIHICKWNKNKEFTEQYCRRYTVMFSIILFSPMLVILNHFIISPTRRSHPSPEKHYHRGNLSSTLCPEPQLWTHPIRNPAAAMAGKQHKRFESLREQSPLPLTPVKQPSSASVFLLYSQEKCDHTLGTLGSFSGLLSQICRNNKKNNKKNE